MPREVPTKLLAAYTPENYEGVLPPFINVAQVGSMVRITVRGSDAALDGPCAVIVVNAWTLNKIAEAFAAASRAYDSGAVHYGGGSK